MMVHMFAKEMFRRVFLLPLMYMLVKEILLAFFPFYCDILRSSHCWWANSLCRLILMLIVTWSYSGGLFLSYYVMRDILPNDYGRSSILFLGY